jgi:hypothetical protein
LKKISTSPVMGNDNSRPGSEGYSRRARKVNSVKRGEVAVKKTMEKLHTVLLFLSTHRECRCSKD